MALPDEEIPGAENSSPRIGGGKDLLYGWLVGRAAADLGLAQALATSEAQRSAQIKRLEESLLGQIRELCDRQSVSDGSAALDAIRTELCRVDEQQRQLAADRIDVAHLESVVRDQLERFESQIQQRNQVSDGPDLGDIRFELKLLVDRVARAEHSVQQAQNRAPDQPPQVEEIVAQRVAAEFAKIREELLAQLQNLPPAVTIAQTVEARVNEKLDALRAEAGERASMASDLKSIKVELGQISARLSQLEAAPSLAASLTEQEGRWNRELDARVVGLERSALNGVANLSAEITALKSRLEETERTPRIDESLTTRIAALDSNFASVLDSIARRDAELTALTGQLSLLSDQFTELSHSWDGNLARVVALEERLAERFDTDKKIADDVIRLQVEIGVLLNRMSQVELSDQQAQSSCGSQAERAQQIAAELRDDWTALKSDLRQQALLTAQSALANVEENIGAKMALVESALERAQQESQGRNQQWNEIYSELQRIGQRLIQAESSVQQTHALAVDDGARAAELRDRVSNELNALQSRLAEQRVSSVNLENLARELNARIDQQQNQLSRAGALLESRNAEIIDIKAQLQTLVDNDSQSRVTKAAPFTAPGNRSQVPIGVTVELSAVKAPSEPMLPTPKSTSKDPSSLLTSYDAEEVTSGDQKKQLQQRISADIERVRAELRKRAGVSR